MALALIIEYEGRRFSFDGAKEVVVGRGAAADVVCDDPSVSREHLRIALHGGRWVVTDSSSLGTYADDERISQYTVDRPVVLRLGGAADGAALRLMVDDPFARPAPLEHGTVMVPKDVVAGVDALVVSFAGHEVRARSGETISIGRGAANDLVVDDPIVSRRHARISQRGDRWVIEDLQSSRGTFVAGSRVEHHDLVGRGTVSLGDAKGPSLRFRVGEGATSAGRNWPRWLRPVVAAAVLLLVVAVGLAVLRPEPRSTDPLDQAIRASVRLEIKVPGESDAVVGSGTIVSADGLILTTASLVDRPAWGLAPTLDPKVFEVTREWAQPPDRVDVTLYGVDGEVDSRYRASVELSDGFLDLAVLRVNQSGTGAELDPQELDLPHIELGDSAGVRLADELQVLGHSTSDSSGPAIQSETVSGFSEDVLGSGRMFIVGAGDWRLQENAGAFGGAMIDDGGRLVGVTSRVAGATRPAIHYRPSNLAAPLVAAAGEDSVGYEREQFVKAPSTGAQFTFGGLGDQPECPDQPTPAPWVVDGRKDLRYAYVWFRGLDPGQAVYVEVGRKGSASDGALGGSWKLWTERQRPLPRDGCAAWILDVPAAELLVPDQEPVIQVTVFQGPSFAEAEKVAGPFEVGLQPGAVG